jgi:hypothetical protein
MTKPIQAADSANTFSNESLHCHTSIGCVGDGGAIVLRQSIASISNANCAAVSVIDPSTIGGHTKRPFSNHLANRQSPLPSQSSAFR